MHSLKKLVLATHNSGKVKEFQQLLVPYNIEIISAGELGLPEPEETGLTFHENARLKSIAAAVAANMPALADDSGMVVPALDGQPGIYSARWGGPDKNFAAATERVRRELVERDAPLDSPAYFVCVLSLAQPDGGSIEFEGRMDGRLSFPPRGNNGFGYDPIFVADGQTQTYGEMTMAEKNLTNHRARAFNKFVKYFSNLNNF